MSAARFHWGVFLPFLVGMLLPLAACGPKTTAPALPGNALQAAFAANQARLANAPADFLMNASAVLTQPDGFGGPGRTNRVTLDLWGRLTAHGGEIVRMDVRAGVGTPLLGALQNNRGLLALAHQENRAMFCADPVRLLQSLNVPLPLDLETLARLVYGPIQGFEPGGFRLQLDNSGRIAAIRGPHDSWRLEMEYSEDEVDILAQLRPNRLRLTLRNGGSASLRIKNTAGRAERWNERALQLKLPPSTAISTCPEARP